MNNLLTGFVNTGCDVTLCEILEHQEEPISFQDYEGIVPEPSTRPIIIPGFSEGAFYDSID